MPIGQAQDLPLQEWRRHTSVGATLVVAHVENTVDGLIRVNSMRFSMDAIGLIGRNPTPAPETVGYHANARQFPVGGALQRTATGRA
jgi:hypothetical protein